MDKITLPITKENGYYEIRLESIGGLGANLWGTGCTLLKAKCF